MQKFLLKQESHSDLHSDRETWTHRQRLFKPYKLSSVSCVLNIQGVSVRACLPGNTVSNTGHSSKIDVLQGDLWYVTVSKATLDLI